MRTMNMANPTILSTIPRCIRLLYCLHFLSDAFEITNFVSMWCCCISSVWNIWDPTTSIYVLSRDIRFDDNYEVSTTTKIQTHLSPCIAFIVWVTMTGEQIWKHSMSLSWTIFELEMKTAISHLDIRTLLAFSPFSSTLMWTYLLMSRDAWTASIFFEFSSTQLIIHASLIRNVLVHFVWYIIRYPRLLW